ncbi:hypothetical protein [Bacillus sp. BHET2]|uniref:hypothetical protein n=1 Tax=Bacillus sp. BHET2 TaxID=2583818 RepID=UPI001486F34B|nr:hypothetical protein [Bacillus sp. BHET2]
MNWQKTKTAPTYTGMVCIQCQGYGGGQIYFDEVLIRKDGLFLVEELKGLNPEALL